MSYSKEDLAKYRVSRAKESIEEAKLLAAKGHWNTSANRLYYACFYAASGYLVMKGIEAFTHNGIKTAFNKDLISNTILPRAYGVLYNKLFNLRQDADYHDYKDLAEVDISPMIQEVEALVQELEVLTKEIK
jgi:uncharacterized protein